MSVVVRMEMPKGCADCGLLSMDEYDSFYKCPLNSYLVWYDKDDIPNYRMNGCPIICSLPAGHGRLVDADLVKEILKPVDSISHHEPEWTWGELHESNCVAIDNAPTIVPAERSET